MACKVKLLAFDTSSAACSVALLDATIPTAPQTYSQHQVQAQQQGKLILPMINAILEEAGLVLQDIDAIAYGSGPGSFTGARIASSVAQGIGFAASCKVIAISSLAAIAQAAYQETGNENLLIALDARMQEVYWACYRANSSGCVELINQEEVVFPNAVTLPDPSIDWHGVGDGWGIYGEIFTNHIGFQPKSIKIEQLPSAVAMLTLAKVKWESGQVIPPSLALPVYLR